MEPADTPGLLMTVNVTFNVPLLTVVLAVVAALFAYAVVLRYRARRRERRAARVARLIADYFRQFDLEVTVRCFPILDGRRFVAVVESPPIKRFRFSHIVENSLIQHLLKTAGVEVDKVYWRFPLAWPGSVEEDPYVAEGQAMLEKTRASYQVEDASWDSYQATRRAEEADPPP